MDRIRTAPSAPAAEGPRRAPPAAAAARSKRRRQRGPPAAAAAARTPSDVSDARFLPDPEHRAQRRLRYDTARFPFREILYDTFCRASRAGYALPPIRPAVPAPPSAAAAGPTPPGVDVEHELLHLFERKALRPGPKGRNNTGPLYKTYKQLWAAPADEAQRRRFYAALRDFVREVCAPLLGCAPGDVLYQRNPTLRISHPSETPMGHEHTDYDYYHQPSEVNFWLPLTPVAGTNSLWAESAPGAGDFAAFELDYGEAMRFWGNQVRHYTVPNQSGVTRVSLDFRAVRKDRFNPDFVDKKGRPTRFRPGQYYALSSDGGELS